MLKSKLIIAIHNVILSRTTKKSSKYRHFGLWLLHTKGQWWGTSFYSTTPWCLQKSKCLYWMPYESHLRCIFNMICNQSAMFERKIVSYSVIHCNIFKSKYIHPNKQKYIAIRGFPIQPSGNLVTTISTQTYHLSNLSDISQIRGGFLDRYNLTAWILP